MASESFKETVERQHREYDEIYSQDNPKAESNGWIQWKGTDVCMDIHCVCGAHYHFDGDFFYYWRCTSCGRWYAVGQNVKMIPLTDEQAERVKANGSSYYELADDENNREGLG